MTQGPVNVNLIATYIHNNPGCRRVDLKRMLHKAAIGKDTVDQFVIAYVNKTIKIQRIFDPLRAN